MNNEFEKLSRPIANSSGFPLQIRIAEIVGSSSIWRVLLEEHPWASAETQSEGFIDIIIEGRDPVDFQAMVIECKRVRQTSWVFLIPKPSPNERTHARLWHSRHNYKKWNNFGWEDRQTEPKSYESKFCAIQGQEGGRKTLLERTASELVNSIESLAYQEKELEERRFQEDPTNYQRWFQRVYIPVIVTTAKLIVARFDPSSISLVDGSLPSNAVFNTVPYVRFRKSLSSSVAYSFQQTLQDVHKQTERTVFVVNAEGFHDFIENWEITD